MAPLPPPLRLLFILALVRLVQAQCVTSGYVLCLPAGSELGGVPEDDIDNPEVYDSIQSAIDDSAILRRDLASRQDALCCPPDDKCLMTESLIPFCYVSTRKGSFSPPSCYKVKLLGQLSWISCANLQPKKKDTDTTRYDFSDQSYGYLSNGTYYAADGTFVDYTAGYYSSADGSTGTFAPATATATAGAGAKGSAAAATQATATAAAAKGSENHTSATTAPVKGTQQQTVAPTPTTASGSPARSGGTVIVPSGFSGWLGVFHLACLTVFFFFLA